MSTSWICPARRAIVIRHALRWPDVGDGADDVAEGGEMLDVQGGQDVDAGVEQFVNILPPVRRSRLSGGLAWA